MKIFNIDIPFVYIKWAILILLFTSLLGLILWIVCSYYLYKWFKVSINKFNFYLNEYNNECENILKKYGNYPIKRIYLARHPITKFMETALNIVTLNKFKTELEKYKKKNKTDSFLPYHTMIYVEIKVKKNQSKFLLIDKNNCIRISPRVKMGNEYELKDLNIKKNKHTLNNILESTRKRIGNNKFFNWEIYKNNCQILVKEILITLKKFNKSNKKFMYQNEFAKELKISDFSVHIISSLTNIVNLLENLVGFTLWMPV